MSGSKTCEPFLVSLSGCGQAAQSLPLSPYEMSIEMATASQLPDSEEVTSNA